MKKGVFLLVILVFLIGCNAKRNSNAIKVKKQPPEEGKGKTFEFIVSVDDDVPDFSKSHIDYDPETGKILLLPVQSGLLSSVMVIDKDRHFELLGRRGQAPEEINGVKSTAKFIGNGLIGMITMFGESSFLVLNENGDVVKRWPFPKDICRVWECRFYNNGELYYLDSCPYYSLKEGTVIGKVLLENSGKKEEILSFSELRKILDKYSISYKPKALSVYGFFISNIDYVVIYPYRKPEKRDEPIGIIFNIKTKAYHPFYAKRVLKKSLLFHIKGSSLYKPYFYGDERVMNKKDVEDIGDVSAEDLFNYDGIIHVIDYKGKEVGVYTFYDDFYNYLKSHNCKRLYFFRVLGLKDNYILGVADWFSKGKKQPPSQVVVKVKLRKLI